MNIIRQFQDGSEKGSYDTETPEICEDCGASKTRIINENEDYTTSNEDYTTSTWLLVS